MRDFIFWGFKITVDGDCCHEMKRHPAPWKKSYDKPRLHIQMQRHHFTDKGPSSQSYGFSVIMYGCESWTIKKANRWGLDAFELWCWRRLLRVPWTAMRSNQSILQEISPEYSLEGLDWCEFEQAQGVGDGQGSLACYSPWGHKESDTTEWLN